MRLEHLKPLFLQMPLEAQMDVILQVRASRRERKRPIAKPKEERKASGNGKGKGKKESKMSLADMFKTLPADMKEQLLKALQNS